MKPAIEEAGENNFQRTKNTPLYPIWSPFWPYFTFIFAGYAVGNRYPIDETGLYCIKLFQPFEKEKPRKLRSSGVFDHF